MSHQRQLYKRETMIREVFVSAIHTESRALFVQIYDYAIQDSLHSMFFDTPMTEEIIEHLLSQIVEMITEKTMDNLWLRYMLERYEAYKKMSEVSDFKEFMVVFKKELDEREATRNEKC